MRIAQPLAHSCRVAPFDASEVRVDQCTRPGVPDLFQVGLHAIGKCLAVFTSTDAHIHRRVARQGDVDHRVAGHAEARRGCRGRKGLRAWGSASARPGRSICCTRVPPEIRIGRLLLASRGATLPSDVDRTLRPASSSTTSPPSMVDAPPHHRRRPLLGACGQWQRLVGVSAGCLVKTMQRVLPEIARGGGRQLRPRQFARAHSAFRQSVKTYWC